MNNNQNPIAAGNQMPPLSPEDRARGGSQEPPRSSTGPIAGAVIVIVLLVAGGLYFWGAKLNQQAENNVPYIPNDNAMMYDDSQPVGELQSDTSAGLPPQSSTDDVASIESDFNAMDLDQMEAENNAELNNI